MLIEHAVLGLKFAFAAAVPDVPDSVDMVSQRAKYLTRKLILLERDDDAINLSNVSKRPDITVFDIDDSPTLTQIMSGETVTIGEHDVSKRGQTHAI